MTRGTHPLALLTLLCGVAAVATAQPQPAPPPREPSPAELLVGRWRLVKYGGVELPPGAEVFKAFTKDGKYIATTKSPGHPVETYTGTYQLIGNDVNMKADRPQTRQTARVQIVKVTKTELVLQHGQEDDFKRGEWVRDEK